MTSSIPLMPGSGDCELHRARLGSEQLEKSVCQTENYKQRAIQLMHRLGIETANHTPNPVASQCNHSVRHDLRAKSEAVRWPSFDRRSQWQVWLNIR